MHFARRVGVPGFAVWALMVWALWTAHRNGWETRAIVEVAAWTVFLTYVMGGSRDRELPYLICTSCGKRNMDPNMKDPALWSCGYCKRETLIRVGQRRAS